MRTITEDIISWSKDFLELPNEELGNKPVCPYAKQARISGQVDIGGDYKNKFKILLIIILWLI